MQNSTVFTAGFFSSLMVRGCRVALNLVEVFFFHRKWNQGNLLLLLLLFPSFFSSSSSSSPSSSTSDYPPPPPPPPFLPLVVRGSSRRRGRNWRVANRASEALFTTFLHRKIFWWKVIFHKEIFWWNVIFHDIGKHLAVNTTPVVSLLGDRTSLVN